MTPLKFVALGLVGLAFASFAAVSQPGSVAQAQEAGPGTVVVEKFCVDENGDPVDGGPFSFDVTFDMTPDSVDLGAGPFNESDFDFSFDIGCGESLFGDASDGDLGDDPLDDALFNIVIFLNGPYEALTDSIFATISEVGLPENVTVEFGGDCDPNPIEFFAGDANPEPFQDKWETVGIYCTITNTIDLESLVITKECLSGDGDGDVDFNVVVTTGVGDPVDSDSLDCGNVMVVDGVTAGDFRIQEFITGPNANDFLTAIVCTDEDGQTVTPGQLAEVEVAVGGDVECAIINTFLLGDGGVPVDPAPPAPPVTVIVPIDIDNTNDSALNNDNLNTNNNENTNTQEQSNLQEQENDNNQTTTANSSPSVVIDFDE
jgi:hypothetical protein